MYYLFSESEFSERPACSVKKINLSKLPRFSAAMVQISQKHA
jgi:hypothetical protein